jgi:hypothetical protein
MVNENPLGSSGYNKVHLLNNSNNINNNNSGSICNIDKGNIVIIVAYLVLFTLMLSAFWYKCAYMLLTSSAPELQLYVKDNNFIQW